MSPLDAFLWVLSWGAVAVAAMVVVAVIGALAYGLVGAVTDAVDGTRKERK